MTKRNPILVVALTFITFTVYAYYWLYKTTEELREESGREELRPIVDVILAVLTFGLWGLWAAYRNAKIAHDLFEEVGAKHVDRSGAVAIFGALSFVSGWAWLVSMAVLQEDYNRLADELQGDFVPARPRARVETDAPEPEAAAPEARRPLSRWEKAPSAPVFETRTPDAPPVFESNAPAPHVF